MNEEVGGRRMQGLAWTKRHGWEGLGGVDEEAGAGGDVDELVVEAKWAGGGLDEVVRRSRVVCSNLIVCVT